MNDINEIHITIIQYLPLIEIVFSEHVREPLRFLENGLDTIKLIEREFKRRRRKDSKSKFAFFPTYSDINWQWSNDGFNYYKGVRSLAFDNQPIRPLIYLSSNNIKWKINREEIDYLASIKRIELSPLLISKITKNISLRITNQNDEILPNYLNLLFKQCNKEKKDDITKVLEGVFTDTKQINVQASDSIAFIEINEQDFKKLNLDYRKTDLIKFDDVKIYLEKHNKLYLIHKKTSTKLFRRRILKVISLIFSLKFLIERMRILIDMGLLEELWLRKKADLLEYVLSALNPNNYSSSQRINLLLKHYQRVIFSSFAGKMQIKRNFEYLKETIKLKIEEMPTYESSYFFNKKNIFTNRLKDQVMIKLAARPEPELAEKERIMLDFLIDQYKNELSDEGLIGLKVKRSKTLGSVTRNHIRDNINVWLRSRELPTNTFTETELKKPLPVIIDKLGKKDLIVIDKNVKGRTGFLICLNDENDFIKKEIFRSI